MRWLASVLFVFFVTVNDDGLRVIAMTSVRMMMAVMLMIATLIIAVSVMMLVMLVVAVVVVVTRVLAVGRAFLVSHFVVLGAVAVGWLSLYIRRAESMPSSCAETYLGS